MAENLAQGNRTRDPPGARGTEAEKRTVAVTEAQIMEYVASLTERGCVDGSVKKYEHDLMQFYQFLPPGKQNCLRHAEGLAVRAAEAGVRTPHGQRLHLRGQQLFGVAGLSDLQLMGQLAVDDVQPELTRNEYLRLLSAARQLGKERTYLLVKAFAVDGD